MCYLIGAACLYEIAASLLLNIERILAILSLAVKLLIICKVMITYHCWLNLRWCLNSWCLLLLHLILLLVHRFRLSYVKEKVVGGNGLFLLLVIFLKGGKHLGGSLLLLFFLGQLLVFYIIILYLTGIFASTKERLCHSDLSLICIFLLRISVIKEWVVAHLDLFFLLVRIRSVR